MKSILEYFGGDELAASVWKDKYALEGEETPDDMHRRLAKEFARVEKNYWDKIEPTELPDGLSDYAYNRNELDAEAIYQLFKDFKYIVPQGSIMYGLGRKDKYISLSNCFFIGQPTDSYGGILQKDEELVQLMKRRGGVGIDISTLRPSETTVSNSAGTSTGAISFMERFSNSTREVGQNSRRGALMMTIDINHPDVEQFATIKSDLTKVTGANISIKLNKEFMKAVEDDNLYLLKHPSDANIKLFDIQHDEKDWEGIINILGKQDLKFIEGTCYTRVVKAKELWNTIVKQARNNAEPGLLFWDNVNDYSPASVYEQYKEIGTNPCGEITLQSYDSCRLMCLNLFSFVDNPFTDKAKIDYKKLYKIAYEQQRLMDDLVDLEVEAIDKIIQKIQEDTEPDEVKQTELELWQKIYKTGKAGRRTGSGITALADMLAALGIKYDSEEALEITDKVMKIKMEAELDCTIDLSILRGSFEGWDSNKEFITTPFKSGNNVFDIVRRGKNSFYDFLLNKIPKQCLRMVKYGRRNISWSTIAPTGSVSILCQTSSGCEPVFEPFYMRRKKINPNDKNSRIDFTDDNRDKWQEFPVLHPKFKDWYNTKNSTAQHLDWIYTKEKPIPHLIPIEQLTEKELELALVHSPWYKSTANDINWEYRLKMQEVLQKYTSHSISSTLNLPENTSVETVSQIYMKASQMGLKGVTIYREGSRSGVLVSKSKDEFTQHDAPKRPKILPCEVHKTVVKGTEYLVVVGLMDNKPYEIFAQENSWNIKGNHLVGDVIKRKKGVYDVLIKDGLQIENFTKDMKPVEEDITRGYSFGLRHGGNVAYAAEQLKKSKSSLVDFSKAMSRILSKFVETKEEGNCPECKTGTIIKQEGCEKCNSCEYSRCS